MDGVGKPGRGYLREALLALLVVALCFLNFGHISVSAAGDLRVVPDSWCGNPMLPDSPDHSPCHACRIGGGADLPPTPARVAAVFFDAAPVAYADPLAPVALGAHERPSLPRGPPSLA